MPERYLRWHCPACGLLHSRGCDRQPPGHHWRQRVECLACGTAVQLSLAAWGHPDHLVLTIQCQPTFIERNRT